MDEVLIIVGRTGDAVSDLPEGGRMLHFPSLRELDLWRHAQKSSTGLTIEVDVAAALRELGHPRADLRGEVAEAIDALCRLPRAPKVSEIRGPQVSERTFYRRWPEQINESPKHFLDRVRLLHARRLVEQEGFSAKEAAYRAGYASVFAFRAAIVARAAANAMK